jgi:hypothetical protein
MSEWRDMGDAPGDGTSILLQLKNPIPRQRTDLAPWHGVAFVGRHPGREPDGFDVGWQFAAPVGQGGFPDEWFVGWQPVPSPPETENNG